MMMMLFTHFASGAFHFRFYIFFSIVVILLPLSKPIKENKIPPLPSFCIYFNILLLRLLLPRLVLVLIFRQAKLPFRLYQILSMTTAKLLIISFKSITNATNTLIKIMLSTANPLRTNSFLTGRGYGVLFCGTLL